MSLTTETKLYGIEEAKIWPLTGDSAEGLTYGSPVEISGISSLTINPVFESEILRGDNRILDVYRKPTMLEWEIRNAKLSLDALEIMLGGSVSLSGTTPDQTQTYVLSHGNMPKFFKLEGKSLFTDVGDVHFVLYKCKIDSMELEADQENYTEISVRGLAVTTKNNDELMRIVFNETQTAIA